MKKEEKNEIPNIKRQGWSAEEIAEEASNKEADEIVRQFLRGDETDGDPDERDIAGGPPSKKDRKRSEASNDR